MMESSFLAAMRWRMQAGSVMLRHVQVLGFMGVVLMILEFWFWPTVFRNSRELGVSVTRFVSIPDVRADDLLAPFLSFHSTSGCPGQLANPVLFSMSAGLDS